MADARKTAHAAPGTGYADGVVAHRLARQPIGLFVAAAWQSRASTPGEALAEHGVILPTGASSIRAEFDALCARLGIVPSVVAEVDDMAMLRLMAREGIGLAPLPAIGFATNSRREPCARSCGCRGSRRPSTP